MIVGLERPDGGSVMLGTQDLTKLPMYLRARLGIGYLPQEPSVFRKMTTAQNILAVLETTGLRRRGTTEALEELLEEFGLLTCAIPVAMRCQAVSGGRDCTCARHRTAIYFWTNLCRNRSSRGRHPKCNSLPAGSWHRHSHRPQRPGNPRRYRSRLHYGGRTYIRSGKPRDLTEDSEVRRLYLGEKFRM
jgi:lipopolysaccharide export system ATP-binding protein